MKQILPLLLAVCCLAACRKQPDPQPPVADMPVAAGPVNIDITHAAGSQPLELNNRWYVTANGDSLKVSIYKYFISNVKLERADGSVWAAPDSYFLIDESKPASKKLRIEQVPTGNYTGIQFIVGVDSARNVSGAQTGALDAGSGMFWSWNTGYIMAMLEGVSPQAGTNNAPGAVIFHCGGFTGRTRSIRSFDFHFPENIIVSGSTNPTVHLRNDMLEWFTTPWTINFATKAIATEPQKTVEIADNYSDMFTLDHVHNE